MSWKSLCFANTLVLSLGLVACMPSQDTPAGESSEQTTTPTVSPDNPDNQVEPDEDQLLRRQSAAYKELGLDRVETGDLDELIERRVIRALVTYSETYYFLDGPNQRGVTYELF